MAATCVLYFVDRHIPSGCARSVEEVERDYVSRRWQLDDDELEMELSAALASRI